MAEHAASTRPVAQPGGGGGAAPSAATAATTPPTPWPAVLAAACTGMAVSLNVGKVPLSLPVMRSELGLTLVQAGWVSSVLITLAVFSALALGLAAGRIGALRMVLGGLLLSALASLAALGTPEVNGFVPLLATRIVEGAGFLSVVVAAPTLISAAAPPHSRRFALAIWGCYMATGAGTAMALSPLLLPTRGPLGGWRAMWLAAACGLLLSAAALWRQRRHYASAAPSALPNPPLRQTLAVLRQPLPWLLGLGFGCWGLQHFALIVWMPTFLREQRGLADAPVALLTCVMLLANVPGNLLGGALMQRGVPRGRLIALASVVTGLCGWGAFSDALPDLPRYALCVALSFVGGVIPAAALSASALLARTPQQIGAVQGLVMQCTQLGQFIGTPLIASVVSASGHWSSARWVTAAAALLGCLLGLAAWRDERRLLALARSDTRAAPSGA